MRFALLEAILTHVAEVVQVLLARQNYYQAERLHARSVAADVSQHFQTLSQDLFATAKEADRDVWEQHNERFNNLNLLAVLMLSVTASLVTEGTFDYGSAHQFDGQVMEAAFVLATALASTSLLICLAASFRATRNMSHFMLARSAALSARIDALVSDRQLSVAMQRAYAALPGVDIPSREELVREIYEADTFAAATFATAPAAASASAARAPAPAPTAPSAAPPRIQRSKSFEAAMNAASSRVRFADFFDQCCRWLETTATVAFASGSTFAIIAIALLVHNEFQRGVRDKDQLAWWLRPSWIFSFVTAVGLTISAFLIRWSVPADIAVRAAYARS
jgi:hypothetical protein